MFVQLLDGQGKTLGLVAMLDTPSYSRSPAGELCESITVVLQASCTTQYAAYVGLYTQLQQATHDDCIQFSTFVKAATGGAATVPAGAAYSYRLKWPSMYRPTNHRQVMPAVIALTLVCLHVTPAGAAYSYCLKWWGMHHPTNHWQAKPASQPSC
jgi:hypothetical protein